MSETTIAHEPSPDHEESVPSTVNRKVVFIADGRVSPFLLEPTVDALFEEQDLTEAILDLSTQTGISIARHLSRGPYSYSIFDTEPLKSTPEFEFDIDELLEKADEVLVFEPDYISSIDAGIVLVPVAAADGGAGIDASEGTITSILVPQLKEAQQSALMILPPELGLRRRADDSYVRAMLRLKD